ncbi:MAG: HAD family hydrolase [Rahnella inusitata]|jgi:phosphatidylglycerophosphatase C|uniref:HAD-IB family hydrolase n=1 Tax=Rahnella inusitata TaxID=58169 RepID=A0ABX9NZG1_9GAMM|nr:HAD family hydrolase [Rahnella inusitata]NMC25523.1 HAD family hydrolase [Serratia sp. (in: enterobacteria)]QUT17547.1 HAD family hydrolase [Rahnella inusitata]RJT12956.1 HAD-IB family hydrolase [Rahnella inusitata]
MVNDVINVGNSLSVFDFDGTLTKHDSFVPFLRFAFGKRVFARRMVRLALPTLKCVGRRLTRDELKEVLIHTFMTGVDAKWIEEKAAEFCERYWTRLMRPSGLIAVATQVNSGAIVTICSASPAMVLKPFAERLGIRLIGTNLEVKDGVLTGRISGHNCRCGQKVERLEAEYGPLSSYHLRAWGDTRGDYEMLAAAQEPYWRHFHGSWAKRNPPIARIKQLQSK